MKLFWVSSGDLQMSVYARTVGEAAEIALKSGNWKSLGQLMSVREYTPKREDWYMMSEHVLKRIGWKLVKK